MVASSWFTAALGAVSLSFFCDGALAKPGTRHASGPSYRNVEACPERCSVSGPNTGNWSVYSNFKQFKSCKQTLFYDFSLYDQVDEQAESHRIYACSSFGPDFARLPQESSTPSIASAEPIDVHYEVGWLNTGFGLAESSLRSVIKQLRKYVSQGYGATDKPFIMFGQSGQATLGVYIGQGLLNQGFASALKIFEDNLSNLNVSAPSLAMQLCESGYDSSHIFGVVVTSNGTFSPIQNAIKTWSNATCLSFPGSTYLTGQATFATPLVPSNGTTNSTISNSTINLNAKKRHSRHIAHHIQHNTLHRRAECKTVQVESGDSCAALASKCGISPSDFTKYNPGDDFCAKLMPKQHACCSSGDMPDFSPKQNSDGSCHTYQVKTDDNCDNLAAEYSLTKKDIEGFNEKTWGWNGCKLLFVGTNMCLSKGTPPFPAPIANALCGPQKPGSKPPSDDTDIAELNPCPLNACCNIWGQCGITKDFCVDTNTGAPGTAKPGTFGCISNCGTDIVKGSGGGYKIGYFEGYGMNRECLFQDASQIDTSQYTHLHFAFGTLTSDFEVEVGDALSSYNFGEFRRINGAKRVLSFGGWAFSTEPATYSIFRNGVKSANRLKMAKSIVNFINEHDLDGVDIDWEYPGAPDIPGIPPADKDDGRNYLAFLVILKNLLGRSKTVSIAAPSSYWYLKQYPIEDISKVIDYIVFMTYDLHGQWDTDNANSQEGCANGNCLRSQVNLTETKQSLAMITKAGVPGSKVIVGITSYGRSFKMAEPGCWGPDCLYSGDRMNSNAAKGKCTGTGGYIADAEIAEIMEGSKRAGRVVKSFVDSSSNSDVLVYDDTEWVSYMSSKTKKTRAALYSAWGMGGTTDWATDLQIYNDVPEPAKNWAQYKQMIVSGDDPKTSTRTGHWTDYVCTNKYIDEPFKYTPSERWKGLDADSAWEDAIKIWKEVDSKRNGVSFSQSLGVTFKIQDDADCRKLVQDYCQTTKCSNGMDGPKSGPAARLIWNALVSIHTLHADFHDTLFKVASTVSTALDDLENKFAPIPPEEDNTWLLLLIDLITLGTLSAAGPFFNSFLKTLPTFAEGAAFDNIKDTTMNLIGQSTTIAKDLLPSEDAPWTPEKQDSFSNYMGQTINGWANVTAFALEKLFDGSNESIDVLWKTISNGKLSPGKADGDSSSTPEADGEPELRAKVGKSFFGYSIPALWKVSKTHAFVIDSGYSCDENNPLGEYLEDDTMAATWGCVDDKLYYLVNPEGDASGCKCHYYDNGHCENVCSNNKFSAPPGLDSLDGTDFGGITKEDLITGSVRTYLQNGGKNGGKSADPDNSGTQDELLKTDVTTPGFIRLPVCSPERAFQSWDTAKADSSDNYPCDIPPGKDDCGDSSFENQTSGASPDVEDCLAIIKNIEGDGGTEWTTQVVGKNQRKIASAGSCAFGVEATKVNGNVNFKVGGQDVIDIINEAVKQFGGDGKVGAKGDMKCNGNTKDQDVKWGIY
jgi:GH18 family chitinase